MRKRLWVVISTVAIVVVAAIFFRHGRRQSATVEAAPGPPSAEVAVAQRGDIDQVLTMAGQFQPYQVVDVHPKVTGFIRRINVDIGDRVHQGETLAVLEVPELQAQVAGTVSEVARSRDEITRAEHEVARAESMHEALRLDDQRLQDTAKAQPGLVAQQELDDAQSKDLSSAAEVDAAKAALSAAQKGLQVAQADNQRVSAIEDYTHVVAPLDGVIIWRYADTGALIQSGIGSNNQDLPIVKLAQTGIMRLRLPVPEQDIRYVHLGDQIQVRVDAINRSFSGKVVRFTREVNFETRTMETEVDVPNNDLSIDSGMYAIALLRLDHAENAVTIPVGAVALNGNQLQVYTLDSANVVHIRNVQVGIEGSQLAEIKSGVEAGDRVIFGGERRYREDEVVTPVMEKTPASETAHASGGVIDMSAPSASGGEQ
jgi:RND family efflux transporter MFP subunit